MKLDGILSNGIRYTEISKYNEYITEDLGYRYKALELFICESMINYQCRTLKF